MNEQFFGTHHVWMLEQEISGKPAYLMHLGWSARLDRASYTHPVWTHDWQGGAMFHIREAAESVIEQILRFPIYDDDTAHGHHGWKVVAHDIEVSVDASTSAGSGGVAPTSIASGEGSNSIQSGGGK